MKVACLQDVTRGKLWAYGDPQRRLSKRKKGELDLIRLAEAYPELKSLYPVELQEQLNRGGLAQSGRRKVALDQFGPTTENRH